MSCSPGNLLLQNKMERLCYYRLDRLAGPLVIDLRSAECSVVMEGAVVKEDFDAECNTYCITLRLIHSLKTERADRRGLIID